MILAVRRHLLATNIFFLFVIFIMQKFIQLFCIIEKKACKNTNCPKNGQCDDRCVANADVPSTATSDSKGLSADSSSAPLPPSSPKFPVKGFRLIPSAMRKAMRNFGFGEGHYQLFVEEKQRQKYISKSCLNAAIAEVKLNPN